MEREFKAGQKVHYTSPRGEIQNGIVKSVRDEFLFVVFHCNGEWDDYENYTGQSTPHASLQDGWIESRLTPA